MVGRLRASGAIGEGIMGRRILTGGASITGSSLFFGWNYSNYAHDLMQVTNLPRVSFSGTEAKFELKVNFTSESGSPLSTQVTVSRSNTNWFTSLFTTGKISYEVKTNSPTSTPAAIGSSFTTGVQQVIDRSKADGVDAGVLVFDKDAYEVIKNLPSVREAIIKLNANKNAAGEQMSFLRLESSLHYEAERAYYGIRDKIMNINP